MYDDCLQNLRYSRKVLFYTMYDTDCEDVEDIAVKDGQPRKPKPSSTKTSSRKPTATPTPVPKLPVPPKVNPICRVRAKLTLKTSANGYPASTNNYVYTGGSKTVKDCQQSCMRSAWCSAFSFNSPTRYGPVCQLFYRDMGLLLRNKLLVADAGNEVFYDKECKI